VSASKAAKEAGFKSLAELSEISGVGVNTLHNWCKSSNPLFKITIESSLLRKSGFKFDFKY